MRSSVFSAQTVCLVVGLISGTSAYAQATGDYEIDTAKSADTVSPYGVSYHTGSFTYSVPLFTIGEGEWPNQITVSLDYDSSGARRLNDPWTISIARRLNAHYSRYITGFEGDEIEDLTSHGLDVVLGNRSKKFELGGPRLDPANFTSVSLDGNSIDFIEGLPGRYGGLVYDQHGDFLITGRDGTTIEFSGGLRDWTGPFQISSPATLTTPNGIKVHYTSPQNAENLSSYDSSSSGLIVRRYGSQICAFNTAYIDVDTITDCSQSSLVATITEIQFGYRKYISSITRPDGGTFNFQYQTYQTTHNSPGGLGPNVTGTRRHLSCVKEPGQSVCSVINTYDPCDGPGFTSNQGQWAFKDSEWSGSRDRVIRQDFPDGRFVTYSYPYQASPCRNVSRVTMDEAGATTQVVMRASGVDSDRVPGPVSVTDPLSRTTQYTWTGDAFGYNLYNDKVASVEFPEGNRAEYTYDSRGNLTERREIAKPGSSIADVISTAVYPSTCTNAKTCNKPISVTDAEGNTTTYTYAAGHGGVLSVIGPVVNGVSPSKRFYYVQREAWLRSGSGYAKTGDPVWLLSEERSCRTTALDVNNGTCAGGIGDMVRTIYDYGPDSGPNNLWLRGIAVIADGETQRTCYSYDQLGRKISETQPKANLASCS